MPLNIPQAEVEFEQWVLDHPSFGLTAFLARTDTGYANPITQSAWAGFAGAWETLRQNTRDTRILGTTMQATLRRIAEATGIDLDTTMINVLVDTDDEPVATVSLRKLLEIRL